MQLYAPTLTGKAPEYLEEVDCDTEGIIPPFLDQISLYRNGPGQFDVEKGGKLLTAPHWYDCSYGLI